MKIRAELRYLFDHNPIIEELYRPLNVTKFLDQVK